MNRQELHHCFDEAVELDDADRVRMLFNEYRQQLIEEGWLPKFLDRAAENNKVRTAKTLVELGVDINSQYMLLEPTYSAAYHGAYETLVWLLDHGANLHQNEDGIPVCRAMDAASITGHLKIV